MAFSARQRSERRLAARARAPEFRRALGWSLALGALGAVGVLAGGPEQDSVGLLTWIAVWSVPAGCLLGAARVDLLRFGFVAPAVWMFALALTEAGRTLPLASPTGAAMVWTGLFAGGAAFGRAFAKEPWRPSALLLLLAMSLVALPGRGGARGRPWPPAVAATLLDLSPAALVCESAGVRDWMWREGLYEPAGTDRLSRTPWRGSLAGPASLLVGCVLAGVASRFRPLTHVPPEA